MFNHFYYLSGVCIKENTFIKNNRLPCLLLIKKKFFNIFSLNYAEGVCDDLQKDKNVLYVISLNVFTSMFKLSFNFFFFFLTTLTNYLNLHF